MSRHIPAGGFLLEPDELRMLFVGAGLMKLRQHYRARYGNQEQRFYRLLTDITAAVYTNAEPGNETRQDAASEEPHHWTVRRLATTLRRSERAVRLDAQNGILQAEKVGSTWTITPEAATTYLESRRAA